MVQQAADAEIAGKCQVSNMETEIVGTAKRCRLQVLFTVQGSTLTYTGTVEGDAMSGDIEVAGAYGKFTGKRSSPR